MAGRPVGTLLPPVPCSCASCGVGGSIENATLSPSDHSGVLSLQRNWVTEPLSCLVASEVANVPVSSVRTKAAGEFRHDGDDQVTAEHSQSFYRIVCAVEGERVFRERAHVAVTGEGAVAGEVVGGAGGQGGRERGFCHRCRGDGEAG